MTETVALPVETLEQLALFAEQEWQSAQHTADFLRRRGELSRASSVQNRANAWATASAELVVAAAKHR